MDTDFVTENELRNVKEDLELEVNRLQAKFERLYDLCVKVKEDQEKLTGDEFALRILEEVF